MTGGQIANVDLIKQVNSAAVYRLIDLQGPISRVKIAELSQLAPASVTKITRQLIEHGLIKETSPQASTGGRRAISLTTIKHRFQFVSAKLGRGYLQLALYDLDGKELDQHITQVTEIEQQPVVDMLLREIGAFIDSQQDRSRNLISIALTMPGLVNPESGMVIYTPSTRSAIWRWPSCWKTTSTCPATWATIPARWHWPNTSSASPATAWTPSW